jgi:hypothetical protein
MKRPWGFYGGLALTLLLALFGTVVAVSVAVSVARQQSWQGPWQEKMTPAQHLKEAQFDFRYGMFEQALHHAKAITDGPLAPEAKKLADEIPAEIARRAAADEIVAAQAYAENARRAAQAEERRKAEEAAKEAEEAAKEAAVSSLQSELKNLGYELTVVESEEPGEVIITSKDFDDTDHRVRFLSVLQRRAAVLCLAGFKMVRLKSSAWFVGFNDVYSLDCLG